MRKRTKIEKPAGNYFVSDKPNIKFCSSGCGLLDCALGGGWAIGRIANIVGDKSTAKTALATEALINFIQRYPKGRYAYRDCEAAYDKGYAAAMGLPIDKIDFGNEEDQMGTVEQFAADFDDFLDKAKSPGIYVLDSLDSLSDDDEMKQELGAATYGTKKAKLLSTMFRKMKGKIEKTQTLLIVVSQVRDNIGAMMGEKHKRSGGRALDFYASQVLWLANLGAKKRTVKKVERPDRVRIKAQVKKNKVGLPFRQCEFEFLFGYGIDDVKASIEWLDEVGRLDVSAKTYLTEIAAASDEEYSTERAALDVQVKEAWAEIETSFLPTRRKYK